MYCDLLPWLAEAIGTVLAAGVDPVPYLDRDLPAPTPENVLEVAWGTVVSMWWRLVAHIPLLIAGAVILLLTWLVATTFDRFEARLLSRFALRGSQRTLIAWLTGIAIWIVGLLTAATVVFPGLTPSNALAALGLGSIAIGLAFKDIFGNFFAGMLILWRFPFESGDFIECEGVEGMVEDVTIRNTLLRKVSGELVIIPNATIFNNVVHVLTNRALRRATVMAGVAYGENVDKARRVIQDAVARCKTVSSDPPVEIFAHEFAESSIKFEVSWWTKPTPLEIRRSRDEVVAAVKTALNAAGIEIPFPYRTLTFRHPVQLDLQADDKDRSTRL
jgi:small conductance mechanosensitive channel